MSNLNRAYRRAVKQRETVDTASKFMDIVLKCVTVALHDELGLGKTRIKRVNEAWNRRLVEFQEDAEAQAEFAMHRLDQECRKIMGDIKE